MTWDGWTDALAGLLRYEYEVYELGHDGSTLGENQGKMVKSPTTIELSATSVSYWVFQAPTHLYINKCTDMLFSYNKWYILDSI